MAPAPGRSGTRAAARRKPLRRRRFEAVLVDLHRDARVRSATTRWVSGERQSTMDADDDSHLGVRGASDCGLVRADLRRPDRHLASRAAALRAGETECPLLASPPTPQGGGIAVIAATIVATALGLLSLARLPRRTAGHDLRRRSGHGVRRRGRRHTSARRRAAARAADACRARRDLCAARAICTSSRSCRRGSSGFC